MIRPSDPLPAVRRLILALLLFGLVGTTTELLLLEHFEDSWMLVPLFLNGLAMAVIVGHLVAGGRGSILMMRAVMIFLIMAGLAGMVLHFRGSLEFQVDMDPLQSRWELFKKVMMAKAPPTLAPGIMAQLGFLGLVYTYRHPALRRDPEPSSQE